MSENTGNLSAPPIGKVGYKYGFSVGERRSGTDGVNTSEDKDMFLKLLVAQMKYQDPTKPTDATQFLAQTAQFTLVEKMEALQDSQEEMVAANQLQAATALVGRTVSYSAVDAAGATVTRTGAVSGVSIDAGVPTLLVGTEKVLLTDITRVTATPAPTPSPTTPAPAPAPSTQVPATPAPTTQVPTTPAPTTPAPTTPAPAPAPTTQVPTTPAPTPAPTTQAPTTAP